MVLIHLSLLRLDVLVLIPLVVQVLLLLKVIMTKGVVVMLALTLGVKILFLRISKLNLKLEIL